MYVNGRAVMTNEGVEKRPRKTAKKDGGAKTKNGGATTNAQCKMMEDKKQALLGMQSRMSLISSLLGHPSKLHNPKKKKRLPYITYAQQDTFKEKAFELLESSFHFCRSYLGDLHLISMDTFGLLHVCKLMLLWVVNLANSSTFWYQHYCRSFLKKCIGSASPLYYAF